MSDFLRSRADPGGLFDLLQHLLALRPRVLRVGSAYFDCAALHYTLLHAPESFELQLLLGFREQELARRSIAQTVQYLKDELSMGLADTVIPTAGLLLNAIEHGHLIVRDARVLRDFEARFHARVHWKLYIGDDQAVINGSANFTRSGMYSNYEAVSYIDHPPEVLAFLNAFLEMFAESVVITDHLAELFRWMLYQRIIAPYECYLLLLSHLYPGHVPLPAAQDSTRYRPATFQADLVTMARLQLEDDHRCLLVSPTGSGKTVIASRLAAELHQLKVIDRVVVIGPAHLRKKWRQHVVDYAALRYDFYSMDSLQNAEVAGELQALRPKTLIVLDEIHNFRNRQHAGSRREVQRVKVMLSLQQQWRGQGPLCLGMTATPYSKQWHELATELAVLGQPRVRVRGIRDVRDLPVLHVTLPFIAQEYGKEDQDGQYLDYPHGPQRFPDVQIQAPTTFPYDHNILRELAALRFQWIGVSPYRYRGQAFLMLKCALSSPPAFQHFVETMLHDLHRYKLENRKEVGDRLRRLQTLANRARHHDEKLAALLTLVKTFPADEPVILFTQYRRTARYVADALSRTSTVAVITADISLIERTRIMERFAPLAQGLSRSPSATLQVLVTTDALSEGVDLQDARHLIHYDLPWSPLTLVQRQGRTDRPTATKGHVRVYALRPDEQGFDMLLRCMAMLEHRGRYYQEAQQIPLFGPRSRTDLSMRGETGFVKTYFDAAMDYQEYERMRDDLTLGELPLKSVLTSLAKLTPEKRDALKSLPPFARSALRMRSRTGYVVLCQHADTAYVLLLGEDGQLVNAQKDAGARKLAELIACPVDEPLAPLPEAMDQHVARGVQAWASQMMLRLDEVREIASCALVREGTPP